MKALAAKSLTHVHKLSGIFACARETLTVLENSVDASDEEVATVPYVVKKVDVLAAFDIVQQSILTYCAFKVTTQCTPSFLTNFFSL